MRPFIGRELKEAGGPKTCVEVSDQDKKLTIGEKSFQFDRVFSTDSEQKEMFDVCARNLVLGCFAGYNLYLFSFTKILVRIYACKCNHSSIWTNW